MDTDKTMELETVPRYTGKTYRRKSLFLIFTMDSYD